MGEHLELDLRTEAGRREAARLGLIDAASEPATSAPCQWQDEKAFMWAVIDLATRHCWKVFHVHNPTKAEEGFPDLLMLRSGRMIAAECKMPGQFPTAAQEGWLAELEKVAGCVAVVWRPENWPEIQELLK